MQYRGFGALHSRLLLAQQCDIEMLERELNMLDDWDSKTEGMAVKLKFKARDDRAHANGEMGADFPYRRPRPEVIANLKQCLMEYGKCSKVQRCPSGWTNDVQISCC